MPELSSVLESIVHVSHKYSRNITARDCTVYDDVAAPAVQVGHCCCGPAVDV